MGMDVNRVQILPRKAGAFMGWMCSGLIMLSTLFPYFLSFPVPWFATQLAYIVIIGLSGIWIFLTGETSRVATSMKFVWIYLLPFLLFTVSSVLIWLLDGQDIAFIRRGVVPIAYQVLQIFSVGAMSAMLGTKAIRYTVYGLLLGNAAIAASVLMNRGLGTGISEMIRFFASFGNANNATSMGFEIHDLTFAMGELVIYYILFGQKEKNRWLTLILCTFFFILGWKRIALPSILLIVAYGLWIRKKGDRFQRRLTYTITLSMVVLAFAFVIVIRTGLLRQFTDAYGINMMGRTELYAWIESHYQLSITFLGRGIGYITKIMGDAIAEGTAVLNHELSIHSDILARYIELGFVGYAVWSLLYYWYTFYFILKHYSARIGLIFFVNLFYCYVTYFTDNTMLYYHVNLVLRLLPLCAALESQEEIIDMIERKRMERMNRWKAIK